MGDFGKEGDRLWNMDYEERGVANTFDLLVWWVGSGEKRDQGKKYGPYRKLRPGFFFFFFLVTKCIWVLL